VAGRLTAALEGLGARVKILPIQRWEDVEREMAGHYQQMDRAFFETWFSGRFRACDDQIPGAQSLVVVAVPSPVAEVRFSFRDGSRSFTVPPTYIYRGDEQRVSGVLSGTLGAEGLHFKRAELPAKLLAARSGLGEYGRNNICYVGGMGSFCRLMTYYAGLLPQDDDWRKAKSMDACEGCSACMGQCPTGSIRRDRFLIEADRCLTSFNEMAGHFPSWLDPRWHHCLVGCMRCQVVCPQNRDYLGRVTVQGTFDLADTSMILEGLPLEDLPARTREKLEVLGLKEYYPILGRNISLLVSLG
jgi:epoxyqueuosine reductase